jgi:hypothetical protein
LPSVSSNEFQKPLSRIRGVSNGIDRGPDVPETSSVPLPLVNEIRSVGLKEHPYSTIKDRQYCLFWLWTCVSKSTIHVRFFYLLGIYRTFATTAGLARHILFPSIIVPNVAMFVVAGAL